MAKTEIEILKETIDALEKLLQIKDAIIGEQERRLAEHEQIRIRPAVMPSYPPQPSYPYQPFSGGILCTGGSPNFMHEYDPGANTCKHCGYTSIGLGIAYGGTSGNPSGV